MNNTIMLTGIAICTFLFVLIVCAIIEGWLDRD
jgi:hypothetical protein